jgi:hypothetical protein
VLLGWSQLSSELESRTRFGKKDRREDAEEDVSSYWMELRQREYIGIEKRKH